ncbi:hypothetical protein B0H17DRAFT_1026531 [Mycena rosella]|uniref:Arrestin-like N-terminal domain-containing protein n=1 Tax=Mycena rosella TaxID=1033263 RepID=A0AAD7AXZ6_MYCRO|nr:hypothetical protein B0H17DRAFT_1026531 [Mycena rosella]
MTSATPQPITLNFQNFVRVAGETIEGSVDLNVALAQEDHIEQLRIKFRGAITTYVPENRNTEGQTRVTHTETVPLVHSDISLWTQGAAFPEAGSHVLVCPFRFQLPGNLPPSFICSGSSRGGAVSYSLEVVGDRPGLFRANRRVRRIISVVPAASQIQLLATESLRHGWMGQWKDIKQDEKLRTGIWGDYSHAWATLSIPDLPSFPIATAIPFSFHVVTETKVMNRSERPEEKPGKPLFPAPPTKSGQLTQVLHRETEIRVRGRTRHAEDTFDLQGIRSLRDIETVKQLRAVEAVVDEPEWIPKDTKDRGIWRRAVHFNSTFSFPFAPTYSTQNLDWVYFLQFVVPFPGIGNNLKLQFPIHLGAGSPCPPPPIGVPGSSSLTYADVLPAGPLPCLTYRHRIGPATTTTGMTRRNNPAPVYYHT